MAQATKRSVSLIALVSVVALAVALLLPNSAWAYTEGEDY